MLNKIKNHWFLGLIFLLGCWFTLFQFSNHEPYPTGDGIEYILTTEAWLNHGSPDIRVSDYNSFKKDFCNHQSWASNYKSTAFDAIEAFLNQKNRREFGGFYRNAKGDVYGYHFPFYSLLNVPARKLCALRDVHPMLGFTYTNIFLLGLFLFVGLFLWNSSLIGKLFGVACVFFSGLFYYTNWTHPESFTAIFIAIALICWWNKQMYLGLFFLALASLQNQPLVFLLGWMALSICIEKRFHWKTILKVAGVCSLFLLPSFYFLYLFNTTSLIKDAGYLDPQNINFQRVFGFFFDFNQGMVIGLGLLMLFYVPLLAVRYYKAIKFKSFSHWDFLPLVILAMTLMVSAMSNWNHGMAIVNRYSVWIAMPLIFHSMKMLFETTSKPMFIGFWAPVVLSQLLLINTHQPYNRFDWSNLSHMPIAIWFLDNHAGYYNPDPQIFIGRTARLFNFTQQSSPVFYISTKNKKVTKVAVHQNNLDTLRFFGYPETSLHKAKVVYSGTEKWYYIDDFEQKAALCGKQVLSLVRKQKIEVFKKEILENPQWMIIVKEKAKKAAIKWEDQVLLEAEYCYNQSAK